MPRLNAFAIGLALLLLNGTAAVSTFNSASGQLTIPVLRAGDSWYKGTVITVGSILSIGAETSSSAQYDRFALDDARLTIASVTDGNVVAYNVVVTVGSVVSLGSQCASFSDCVGDIVVSVSRGNRTIADTNSVAGEPVSFTATASGSNGGLASSEWLINGLVVATGLSPTIELSDGSSVVTFRATDGSGATGTADVTISVEGYSTAQDA
jgi:hypothetical protein